MATTIITKNGSGAPAAGDLVQGELAVDLTNQTLYSKDSSGNVFKVGDTGGGSPGTFTDLVATDSFTSPGIDDNATSTAITIDASENVGIGTDSPDSQLHVKNENGSGIIQLGTAGGTIDREWKQLASASNGSYIIQDTTAGINRLTVDTAGNVGIGVAPESWTTYTPVQVQQASLASYNNGDARLTNNGYYNGGWKYIDSRPATQYLMDAGNGIHTWSTAASGTADGAITWSERMRIDNSGTTTVTGGFLAARPGAGVNATAIGDNAGLTSQQQGAIGIGAAAGQISQGSFGVAVGNAAGYTGQGTKAVGIGSEAGKSNQGESAVAVGDQAGESGQSVSAVAIGRLAGQTSQGSRAVAIGNGAGLTGQGNNSIAIGQDAGKTNQGANGIIISSQGTAQQSTGANHIVLRSPTGLLAYNGTNAWTLDGGGVVVPNGDLMVGTTSPDVITNKATGIRLEGSLGTANLYSNTRTCLNLGRANNGVMMQFYINGANTSGGISTTQGGTPAFFASSDERLKDNIVDHESELANVMSLRPTRWDWKKDEQGSGEGFIAQELEQTAWSDLVAEGEDGFKTVAGLGAVETRLIKAMQEQQVMIETLQAEVAALKGA